MTLSMQDVGEAWITLEKLKQFVLDCLHTIGARQLLEQKDLHYSPAGDGGVLAFGEGWERNAFIFARVLENSSRGVVRIRVGVATGMVVILNDELPVGAAVLEADSLSSIPESTGQICVNSLFWNRQNEATKGMWRESSVDDWPDALLLTERRDDGTYAVFSDNLTRARNILTNNPDLDKELMELLRDKYSDVRNSNHDLVSTFIYLGIESFLREMRDYLEPKSSYDHAHSLSTLLDVLLPVGVGPEWATENRKFFNANSYIEIPAKLEGAQIDVLRAAIWKKGGELFLKKGQRGDFASENRLDFSGTIENPSPTKKGRLEAFRKNIISICHTHETQPPTKADKEIEETLTGWHKLKHPLVVLSSLIEPNDLPGFPWHLIVLIKPNDLLIMRNLTEQTGKLLNEVYGLLDKLKKNGKRNTRKK